MKKLLLITFISLLGISCEKEEAVLKGSYSLPKTMQVGILRMHTSSGTITDEMVIKNFLKTKTNPFQETDFSTLFYASSTTIPVEAGDNYCNITFSDDKAMLRARMLGVSTGGNSVEAETVQQGELLILTANTGSAYYEKSTNINDYFYEDDHVEKVRLFLGLPLPYGSGFEQAQLRMNVPLIIENNQIIIPILFSFRSHMTEHSFSVHYQQYWNILNEKCLTNIPICDTIVIQEGRCIMQKQ